MRYLRNYPALDPDYEQNSWGMIDILTIVLVFFIILYANELKKSVSAPASIEASTETARKHQEPVNPRPDIRADSAQIRQHFAGYLEKGFYIAEDKQSISLVLEEQLSFNRGEASLGENATTILARISELLSKETEYGISIAGHTDDLPIKSSVYPSNWHLATARSIAVAEYFISKGIAPQRISTQGFAEFRPRNTNDSEENRGHNRRVEITLTKTTTNEPAQP